MPYRDPEKQREANREANRRFRARARKAKEEEKAKEAGYHAKKRDLDGWVEIDRLQRLVKRYRGEARGIRKKWDTWKMLHGSFDPGLLLCIPGSVDLTEDLIRKAHRRTMEVIHPDRHPGHLAESTALAKVVTSARDYLLEDVDLL